MSFEWIREKTEYGQTVSFCKTSNLHTYFISFSLAYYFVKDRIENGEVSVSYCPTLRMLADFYTKAVQGGLFTKLRNVLMGYESIDALLSPLFRHLRSVLEKVKK